MSELENEIIVEEEIDKGFNHPLESPPEFIPDPYRVYARPNSNGLVERFFSTCFEEPLEGDILFKEGFGDEYVHVGYLEVLDINHCHLYKVVEGEVVETTAEERQEELNSFPVPEPEINEVEVLKEQLTVLEDTNNFLSESILTLTLEKMALEETVASNSGLIEAQADEVYALTEMILELQM